jgi:hypothetical protein
LLAIVLLHSSDSLVQGILEHLDGFDGILGDVLTQFWSELSHFVDVDTKSLAFANHGSDSLLVLLEGQEFLRCLTHVSLVGIFGDTSCH